MKLLKISNGEYRKIDAIQHRRITELEQALKLASLSAATEISSHIESLYSAKDIRVEVDRIQAYYYQQAKQLKEHKGDE